MKLSFTLFTILLNLACIAQNWTPFPHNQKTWFEFSNETHHAVSLYYSDSLRVEADSTHYYFRLKYINDLISGADDAGVYSSCLNEPAIVGSTEVGETWLDYYENKVMDFISIKNPYTEIDGNYFYEGSLVFNSNLNVDESITITSGSFTEFDKLQIKCIEIKQMDVLGEMDSVKIFNLQSYANDSPVESDFNNFQYLLSKNHGFITFLPFIELLDQPKTTATLSAFEDGDGNLVGELLGNYIKTYEAGDVIERLNTRRFNFGNRNEDIYTKDSITSIQFDENYLIYNFDRLEITKNILPPPPPGFPPNEPADTTYRTNLQITILLSDLGFDPNSIYFLSIYGSIFNPNDRIESFSFSFTNENTSLNRVFNNYNTIIPPKPGNCISEVLPNISFGNSVYNSELGLISSWESLEYGATFTTDLLTYTKKDKAYTPFATLNPVYDITDTLINLKNEYHPLNVTFSGPGVDGAYFNPLLVPDSLHNQLIELTCSHYLGWSTTQTILVRSTDDCNCDDNYQPVCGEDGNTYNNACLAQCEGIAIAYEGACGSISCDDPLQLEIVQQAIDEGCAELIYKKDAEIFIDKTCDGSGLIYNCETQTTCSYSSNESLEENCNIDIFDLALSLNEGDVIWSKPCSFENQGVVGLSFIACGPACDGVGYYIVLEDGTALYPVGLDNISLEAYLDKTVRFTYIEIPNIEIYANGTRPVSILTCIEVVEEEPQSSIFASYPWLSSLVDELNCEGGTKVSEYNYGEIYNFIHIEQADGSGALYFQDGAFYCSDAANFSCLSAYGLTSPTQSWQCENENTNPPVEETIFDQLTWLNTLVNEETCSAGSSITIYTSGSFTFLFIEDDNGGNLYFEDGTFYCKDAPGNSCVQLYGLTNPVTSWVCGNANTNPPISNTIFDKYTWLNTLINTANCEDESKATVYLSGSYNFVFVEDANGGNLYFEDGTFYCKDAPGNSCLQLYGLTNPIESWTCRDENLSEICVVDDPFSLPWFQELVTEASEDLCGIKEINQTSYESSTYFVVRIQPIYPECTSDGFGTVILDCMGNIACSINPWLMPGEVNCPANPELLSLNFTGDLIWSYDYGANAIAPKLPSEIQILDNEKFTVNEDYKIYPNPSNGQFTVELSPNKTRYDYLELSSLQGKILQKITLDEDQLIKEIDLTHLPKGMYIMQAKSETTRTTQKIIIR